MLTVPQAWVLFNYLYFTAAYCCKLIIQTISDLIELCDVMRTATCEYCGRVGVRDAFYSKTKRFCSMACSRNYAQALKDGRPIPYQPNVFAVMSIFIHRLHVN